MTCNTNQICPGIQSRHCCPLLLSIIFFVLLAALPRPAAEAQESRHSIAKAGIEQLAASLVDLIDGEDLAVTCRLYFANKETVSGAALTDQTISALEAAILQAIDRRRPGANCAADYSSEPDDVEAAAIAARLADEGRASFVYSMSFFPKGSDKLMLLATAYRPNGRFAAFSGPLDIDTVAAASGEQPSPASSAEEVASTEPVTSVNQVTEQPSPALPIEESRTLVADAVPEPVTEPETRSSTPTDLSRTKNVGAMTDFTDQAAIGTPAEIEAIKAEKLRVMPKSQKPAVRPATGLRIDIGSTSGLTMIKALAGQFLLDQSDTLAGSGTVEDQGDRLQLSGRPDALLQRVDLTASDLSTAFDKLFLGQVDLVLSSEPISQADYDRFAEAFGVDMRSGAGETVIGVEARNLFVHPSNQLPSLTKEVAADIFKDGISSWDQGPVARSGLSGPIQTLAQEKAAAIYDGQSMRPDLILKAKAEIADLVAINPLSIGYSNIIDSGDNRSLPIEECGIVYPPNDFFMRTEDHPLARRLFLYSNPAKGNRFRNAFLFFATSDKGQELIAQHLVNLEATLSDHGTTQRRLDTIRNQPVTRQQIRARLIGAINGARRLSTTFRFRFDSNELRLDQSAARDLANLIRFSQQENIAPDRLMILGFADSDGKIAYNLKLSVERAEAIAKRLITYGIPVPPENIMGFGEEAPVACNDRPNGNGDILGKARNRRVEVWLRDASF